MLPGKGARVREARVEEVARLGEPQGPEGQQEGAALGGWKVPGLPPRAPAQPSGLPGRSGGGGVWAAGLSVKAHAPSPAAQKLASS